MSIEDQRMDHLVLVSPDPGYDPLQSQVMLQVKIVRTKPLARDQTGPAETFGELVDRLRFNKEAYDMEHAEMLDRLPWKEWRTYGGLDPNHPASAQDGAPAEMQDLDEFPDLVRELKFEAIDKLHFLINEMIALGFSDWDEVIRFFYAKQRENHARQDRGY